MIRAYLKGRVSKIKSSSCGLWWTDMKSENRRFLFYDKIFFYENLFMFAMKGKIGKEKSMRQKWRGFQKKAQQSTEPLRFFEFLKFFYFTIFSVFPENDQRSSWWLKYSPLICHFHPAWLLQWLWWIFHGDWYDSSREVLSPALHCG